MKDVSATGFKCGARTISRAVIIRLDVLRFVRIYDFEPRGDKRAI